MWTHWLIWWQPCKELQLVHKLCVCEKWAWTRYVGRIRSHWNFSVKKQRKITHLLVQLIQISVPETHRLAEQKAPFIKWLTPVNYSAVEPDFRHSLTNSQVKTLLWITTRKSHILSINSSTQGFFSPLLLTFSSHSSIFLPLLFSLIIFLHTLPICLCVLCNCKDSLTRGEDAKSGLALVFVCQSRACLRRESEEGRGGGFVWQRMANPEANLQHEDKWWDKKKNKWWWGFFNWLQSFLFLHFYGRYS